MTTTKTTETETTTIIKRDGNVIASYRVEHRDGRCFCPAVGWGPDLPYIEREIEIDFAHRLRG